jgi:hypothetical protein
MTLIETILIIGSVIGGLMTTTCWNIRRSRCEKIETPCLSCMRKVMTEKEMRFDTINSQPDTQKMTRADSEPNYNKAT